MGLKFWRRPSPQATDTPIIDAPEPSDSWPVRMPPASPTLRSGFVEEYIPRHHARESQETRRQAAEGDLEDAFASLIDAAKREADIKDLTPVEIMEYAMAVGVLGETSIEKIAELERLHAQAGNYRAPEENVFFVSGEDEEGSYQLRLYVLRHDIQEVIFTELPHGQDRPRHYLVYKTWSDTSSSVVDATTPPPHTIIPIIARISSLDFYLPKYTSHEP